MLLLFLATEHRAVRSDLRAHCMHPATPRCRVESSFSHRRWEVGSTLHRDLLDSHEWLDFDWLATGFRFVENQIDDFFEVLLQLIQRGALAVPTRQSRHCADVKSRIGVIFDIRSERSAHGDL